MANCLKCGVEMPGRKVKYCRACTYINVRNTKANRDSRQARINAKYMTPSQHLMMLGYDSAFVSGLTDEQQIDLLLELETANLS